MQPFGAPVVPLVNAIRQTSSAAVSHAVNCAGLFRASDSSEPGASLVKHVHVGQVGAEELVVFIAQRSSSSMSRASHSAALNLRLVDDLLEFLRAQQRHRRHDDKPRLQAARKAAAICSVLGPRSSTRLPGTSAMSSTSTCAHAIDDLAQLAIGRAMRLAVDLATRSLRDRHVPLSIVPSSNSRRAVQTLGISDIGMIEQQDRPLLLRRQMVSRKRIDMG